MSFFLRFGVPSVDCLFSESETGGLGIQLPERRAAQRTAPALSANNQASHLSSASICITGPGGTGKSVLAMHLASRYLADCRAIGDSGPKVLYVSTDLKHEVAHRVWQRFSLDSPNKRIIPFTDRPISDGDRELRIELLACHPLQSPEENPDKEGEVIEPLSHYLIQRDGAATEPKVYFVDLASNTAGDDWGFISRVLSVIERPENSLPHLMIIDSVEGFETLVGERDAFGESQPRRSRVAQIMRSASDKCHIVFIVEEPNEGEHLPEEFVTDVLVRLRSVVFRDYGRRTVEIVKSRGQSHTRGQHIFLIRSGAGSTTGERINHDDPPVLGPPDRPHQSYVHVCPSLHYLNRKIMMDRGKGRPTNPNPPLAAFGIRYLDSMLAIKKDDFKRADGDDFRGLPCSTTTALIGNSQTEKSTLGYAFLSRCFRNYAEEFLGRISTLMRDPSETLRILKKASTRAEQERGQLAADDEWKEVILERLDKLEGVSDVVKAAALNLGAPSEERDGIPVILATQDINAERLVSRFLPWLLRKVPDLGHLDDKRKLGCVKALQILMEERSVCRRLEIHDLPSGVLVHIVQRSVATAQRLLFGGEIPVKSEERFKRSWGIRLVIDDFSVIRNTYAEIRDDPLLLRFLIFFLGREGVTTLLIDTQEGHPNLTVPSHLDSELRSLVARHIYTWRFPFYDGNRVAIAAIPSMRPQAPTIIRELREGTGKGTGPEAAPLVVDPHFELYSGIEKGEPKPIPLMVHLFEESAAFETYISDENRRCRDLFTPLDSAEKGTVIKGVPADDYQRLYEFAYIQKDTRLDHTLVFQVDEFWMMKRPGIRRTGASRPAWNYLHAKTSIENVSREEKSERIWAIDPFGWFQKTVLDLEERSPNAIAGHPDSVDASAPGNPDIQPDNQKETPYRRSDDFLCHGYALMDDDAKDLIDRVPFMWDFGFLLCRNRAWQDANCGDRELTFLADTEGSNVEAETFKCVRDVWEKLPKATKDGWDTEGERPSWRVFLEACYQLAMSQTYTRAAVVPAFDLHLSGPPSLSCLILEIWTSEILKQATGSERESLIKLVSQRQWTEPKTGLIDLLERYRIQLFKTWLLLVDVLDIDGLAVAIRNGTLRNREANPATIAVRHWYKSACTFTQTFSVDDPVVPVGLPGHFSVRGDWFLAVAGGSRSDRLADQALDFFNTRSANYERLRSGLGLPVRRIVTDQLRTGIITLDRGDIRETDPSRQRRRVSRVHYENLIRIGGKVSDLTDSTDPRIRKPFEPKDFYWLWRSSLAHFPRHSKIWHDWLCHTVVWWSRMREIDRDKWVPGFRRYDAIADQASEGLKIDAWKLFEHRCNHLVRELKDATLV